MSQPFGLSCRGGLNTNLNQFDMLAQPGFATILRNFEVDPDGGYRRINGYTPFGGDSATRPLEDSKILGVYPYGEGVVVVVGTNIYYSDEGISWIQINKNTGHNGSTEAELASDTVLTRASQGQAKFSIMKAPTGHADTPFGSLSIATGPNKLAHFHITGTGASRVFVYEEISHITAATYIEEHDKHLCVVDAVNASSTVYYSKTNDDRDFSGTGAGSVTISDRINGIKSFRGSLFIFCENTIHRLDDINGTPSVVQITNNVGCLSGYSIQEIGGDLLFLAPDGIRTIAATQRIGDVELGSVSRQIQSIISDLSTQINTYTISSVVLRNKSQYRLFYSAEGSNIQTARGVIGTFTPNGFEWSETQGIQALSVNAGFAADGVDKVYHGDNLGYIYNHDIGSSFIQDETLQNIDATYQTPNLDFGDAGTLKTIQYVKISISPEGLTQPTLRVRYNYEDTLIPQPPDYVLDQIQTPAIFGVSEFGVAFFGGSLDPMVRQAVQGSGFASSFKISSNDQLPSYAINGLYIDYMPSGRR